MDIEDGKCEGRILTWQKHCGDNQYWTWNGNSIVSKTGYALDIQGCTQGTNAISLDHDGGDNQQFKMEGDKIVSLLTGMVLDIKDAIKASNADIIVWPSKHAGVNNQSWEIIYQK